MTSQSIKELSSFFTGTVGSQASAKAKDAAQSFSSLMNQGTSGGSTEKTDAAVKSPEKQTTGVGQVKNPSKLDRSREQADGMKDGMDSKAVDEAKEIADQIAGELKEKLDVTDEELTTAMETLGLTMLDLLDPAALKELFAELSGVVEPMELLTDENLYNQLGQILGSVEELTTDLQKELGLSDEQFEDLLQKLPELETAAVSETVSGKDGEAAAKREEAPVIVEDLRTEADVQTAEGMADKIEVREDEKPSDRTNDESDQSQGQKAGSDFSQMLGREITSEAAGSEQVEFGSYADAQEIAEQVVEQIKVNITEESTSMEMQLNPENLGKLNLTVEAKNGVITAQITTQEEAVRAAIESQVEVLRQTLNEQGVKVEAVEVSVAAHEFEQNLEKGQDQSRRENEKKTAAIGGRIRAQINLLSEEESEEELDEADRLNREMMIQNGNTVDYTA